MKTCTKRTTSYAIAKLAVVEGQDCQAPQDAPADTYFKLFRVLVSPTRTNYVINNDLAQDDTDAAEKESSIRWKIEQFHREDKQITGIESCQCRLPRSQRNHIAVASLVWLRLKQVAHQTKKTVYQLKQQLIDDYLIQQFKQPSIPFA